MPTTKFSKFSHKVLNQKFITVSIFFLTFIFVSILIFKGIIKNPLQNNRKIKYTFPEKGCLLKDNKILKLDKKTLNNSTKLIYILNIDCSICIFNLSKLYNIFTKLRIKNKELQFVIITKNYPCSYITYFIHKILSNYGHYKVWIFQSNVIDYYNLKNDVFLLDKNNEVLYSTNHFNCTYIEKESMKKLRNN